MAEKECLISVVTICFNNLNELIKTCNAVDEQQLHPFEHWIIDGSSTPEISEWLTNNRQPPYRKWNCEPDKGIADAFNKGIAKASGEVIHLLNSGDTYASNRVLEKVNLKFLHHPELKWITGKIFMKRLGKTVLVGKPFDPDQLYKGMRSVSHPTWFVKKTVYEAVGIYDSTYAIAMDYEMMCRLREYKSGFIDFPFVNFDDTGVSSRNYLKALAETKAAFESHFGFSVKLNLWQVRLKLLHALQKTGFGKLLFNFKRAIGLENF